MNTTLREAEFCDPAGVRRKFDVFFVPKRLIRYVQIPTEIDIKASLEKLFGEYLSMWIIFCINENKIISLEEVSITIYLHVQL